MTNIREKDLLPLKKKSSRQMLAQKLKRDYGLLGDKVIELLSDDILNWNKEFGIEANTLYPGQILWLAVDRNEKHHPHKRIEQTRLVTVKLTIHSNEDIDMFLSQGKRWRDVTKQKIARILTETYSQGGVLTQTDVAAILNISNKTVQRYIAEYQKEEDVDLPYRGKIHDIGPTISHKAEIVELMVKGYATPVVARKMNHSILACDRYFKDYKRVVKLSKSFGLNEISGLANLSESLVKNYISLAEKLDYRL